MAGDAQMTAHHVDEHRIALCRPDGGGVPDHPEHDVFYQIDHEGRQVRIVAVGVKDRNRLLIGGEEVTL